VPAVQIPVQVTPTATTSLAAGSGPGGTKRQSTWELSDDDDDDSSFIEECSGGLNLKKSGRMSEEKRRRLIANQDVEKTLNFTPLHFFGCFEDLDTSVLQVVVIHLPSGVDSSTFKPTIKGNLLELEMMVPELVTRGDLLFSHLSSTGSAFHTRVVNFKNFVAKCLGQKKQQDQVYASSKIILPAPALDNKFTSYEENKSNDGCTVVTIEMMVEEAYINGQKAAKKKLVKL